MKKFKVFALVFAIMLSATGLGLLFGSSQPASTQAKVSADETTTLAPGIYTVDTDGKKAKTKDWSAIVSTKTDNSLNVNLSSSDGTYLVCGALPAGVTSLYQAFYSKNWLTNILFTNSFNTSNVTNMSLMFEYCSSLTSLDLSSFDTSKVTNMNHMFNNCSSLASAGVNTASKKYDLNFGNNFDISKVKSMDFMFNECSSLTTLDLSKFDAKCATSATYMFYCCEKLKNLALCKFEKLHDVDCMFYQCSSLSSLDLSNCYLDNPNSPELNKCYALQYIKMPNTMNAKSNITLDYLYLPSQNISGTAIKWYSLKDGDSKGTLVDMSASLSSYASNILTIDPNKSYDEINAEVFTPAKPETPSTGVVLDVVLPVASIVLVLASLVVVAFVGKKKKQY
jgi:surface protein